MKIFSSSEQLPEWFLAWPTQIHTTGMDIPQYYSARACVTLGKDMTWRDLAQVIVIVSPTLR